MLNPGLMNEALIDDIETLLSAISATIATPTSITSGQVSVTTPGTRVALGSSTSIVFIIVTANRTNTGNIYIGDVTVDSSNGSKMERGSNKFFPIDDLSKVYIDADTASEGISYLALIA